MVLETPRGFPKINTLSQQERERLIFDEKRLAQRHQLFEELLIPSLLAQTDKDFSLAVLVTDNLPQLELKRLRETINGFPQAFLVKVPARGFLRGACERALKRAGLESKAPYVTFRIDDDDALAVDYVASLRALATESDTTHAVSFTRGLEVTLGNSVNAQRDNRPCTGAGLALLSVPTEEAAHKKYPTVYQLGAHRKVGEVVPLVTSTDELMFLRTLHGSNISKAGIRPIPFLESPRVDRLLLGRFPTVTRKLLGSISNGPST